MGRKIQNLADELFSMHKSERSLRRLFFRIGLNRIRDNMRSANRHRNRGPRMSTKTQWNRMIRQNCKCDILSGKSRHNRLDHFVLKIGNRLHFMSKILKRHDYRVFCADTGTGGLELIRSQCPDIVLLDLKLI